MKDQESTKSTEAEKEIVYCVEYYSDVIGNGVRKFADTFERDVWCMSVSLDQIYLYEEEI